MSQYNLLGSLFVYTCNYQLLPAAASPKYMNHISESFNTVQSSPSTVS